MSPWSSRCKRGIAAGTAGLALSLGCAATAPTFETSATLPDEPRYPAGADIESPTTLPAPAARGNTGDGLVVLQAPTDPRRARATVEAFFRAMVEESPSALESVLAPQALVQAGSRREPARTYYLARFMRLDYRTLRGQSLFHPGEVDVWERTEQSELQPSQPPLDLAPGEVVIRVRNTLSWAGRQRLFGDELLFRLGPNGAGYVIVEIVEDFSGS
jgi:hypothetical protein